MKHIRLFEEYRYFKGENFPGNKKDPNEPFFIIPKFKYRDKKIKAEKDSKLAKINREKILVNHCVEILKNSDIKRNKTVTPSDIDHGISKYGNVLMFGDEKSYEMTLSDGTTIKARAYPTESNGGPYETYSVEINGKGLFCPIQTGYDKYNEFDYPEMEELIRLIFYPEVEKFG